MRKRSRLNAALAVTGGLGLLALVVVPIVALAIRAPWGDLADVVSEPGLRSALRLSIVVSLVALVLSVLIGFPIAWLLARTEVRGRSLLQALVTLPMVVPPVVGGVALLVAFGRRGLVGQWLDRWFDVQLAYTTTAAVLAATFVSLPFFVLAVEAALRDADRRYEDVARTLGARPLTVLWRVTLPAVRGSVGAGAALAWARALGEFGATITFAGSFEGRTQTMPLAISRALEQDLGSAILLSVVLLAVSIAVLAGLRQRWMPR